MKTYTTQELHEILALHRKYLLGEAGGRSADLGSADLRFANLRSADLRYANLRYANLRYANLRYANLGSANLWSANLGSADLRSADLRSADLGSAQWNDKTQWPAITAILLASWGDVSDDLCRDLMRYDAVCHPDPHAFDLWAAGGPCPYDGVTIGRAASFVQKKELWQPGPVKPYDLFQRLLAEKLVKIP